MKSNQLCIGFIFILLLCLQSITVFSQQYTFRNYSVDEGLAQSQVYAMCEDNNGNMWFGTRGGGLSRFDGIEFKNYTVQEGLISNYIRCLFKDTLGNLWIGTDNGLSIYNGKTFSSFKTQEGLGDIVINDIAEDRRGTIWIATETGIYYIQKDRMMPLGSVNGGPAEQINCLLFDATGMLWAGSEKGLYSFFFEDGHWYIQQFTTFEGLPNNSVTSLVKRSAGGIWVCTYGGGVSIFNKNTFLSITKSTGLASNTVFDCVDAGASTVWFCTASGITKYNTAETDASFIQITETEGLAKNVVMCTLKDSFGNLWFGTSGGGVSKLSSERFIHFTSIKGVFGASVYSIFQDRNGLMWFATSEGGVTTYDGNVYKRFSERNGFTASKVKCIQEDAEGNLWFGTISDGAYIYNGKTFRHYTTKNGLSSNFINYILIDTLRTVWLATAGGGISCLFPAGNGTYKVKNIRPRDGLGSDRIHTLIADEDGDVWAGTAANGIDRIQYSKEDGTFKITHQNLATGLTSNNIRCAVLDSYRNTIFWGTADAGLIAYRGKQIFSFTTKDGLSSNNIYSCILDAEGNLWIGTDKGIDKISLHGWYVAIRTTRHYGRSEGFTGIETMQNAACLDSSGHLWFGTVKSATVFNPAAERGLKTPNVHITGMHLFFDAIEKTVYGKNISSWYSLPKSLVLPYNQNHVSFDVMGVEQSNPEAVRYKWMLEGFDKQWSPKTDKREAVYSNLPPGTYTFKAIAANERGEWTKIPATYTFTIRAPFWQTWWFILLALVVIGLIGWWIAVTSIRKLKQENEREKQRLEVERALIELEQKALRLQMNPHFLFNCLNSIKGLIAEDKPEEAKIYLSKFAKLMRSMLDHSMETFVSLENEIAGLRVYAELENLSRDNAFEFSVEVDSSIDPSFMQIPPMLVQPFVENAILHGMSGKVKDGKIYVRFTQEGNYLRCVIEDNGIGRTKAAELKQNSMQQHKSAAITVTQERLNILNKKLNLESVKISVADLTNAEQQASGTRVTVLIPFQQ